MLMPMMIYELIYSLIYTLILQDQLRLEMYDVININQVSNITAGNTITHYVLLLCKSNDTLLETSSRLGVLGDDGLEGLYLTPSGIDRLYSTNVTYKCQTSIISSVDSCYTKTVSRRNVTMDIIRCLMHGLELDGYTYASQLSSLNNTYLATAKCSDEQYCLTQISPEPALFTRV